MTKKRYKRWRIERYGCSKGNLQKLIAIFGCIGYNKDRASLGGGDAAVSTLSLNEVKAIVKELLERYHAEYALLFGSYARGDATPDSDIDVIIVGGKNFVPRNIFALAEDLREMTGRDADVFEMREVNAGTPFYESVMREGIRIA